MYGDKGVPEQTIRSVSKSESDNFRFFSKSDSWNSRPSLLLDEARSLSITRIADAFDIPQTFPITETYVSKSPFLAAKLYADLYGID